MRASVDLNPDQVERLGGYCTREGISRAEAIRRAVDGLLEQARSDQRKEILRSTSGAWKDLNLDALAFVRALRDEWGP